MNKFWLKFYGQGIPAEINPDIYESIPQFLEASFGKYADYPAFTCMGKTLFYDDMDLWSRKFASFLQHDLKLPKGSRVALMMPNILQYPVALFGLLRAGMICVNVNPLYTARELEHQLTDSGAEVIIAFENAGAVLEKALPKTKVKHVILTGIGDMLGGFKSCLVNFVIKKVKKMVPKYNLPQALKFNQVMGRANPDLFKKVGFKPSDIAFLQYTGGTTGISKGAVLTHRNILANMEQAKAWIGDKLIYGGEIIITPLPLYHIFSLTANCFLFTALGGHNILITNPRDIKGFVKELKKWNFTAITGVNTLFNALIHDKGFQQLSFKHLKVALGGGMAVQKVVAESWKKITGHKLLEGYGLTETSPIVCVNPLDGKDYTGAVGLPVSSTEISIKDEDGQDLGIGDIGEICVKGPQVMQGYWKRADETARVTTEDGFFKTGDIGLIDEKGYVRIVDRKKDMILVSGFNVYPNEVEDILMEHPKVLECAAIGVPHEKSGEVVKVFIVKKDGSLTEDEVLSFCRENLTGYKRPKVIEFRGELPKNNVGKILRRELREKAIED